MTRALTTPPAAGTPRPYLFPRTTRTTLAGGVRLIVAPLTKLPLVTMSVVFHAAGAAADPAGREGLADITALLLLEGTESLDGAALTDRFESLGSALSARADWDSAMVSFTVQPERLGVAAETLRDVLRRPSFPERELSRAREEHRAERLQLVAEPRTLADAAFAWRLYSGASRYRRGVGGTVASVAAITRRDVAEFWRARYSPSAMTIVFAGDITPERAAEVAHSLVSGWSGPVAVGGSARSEVRGDAPAVTLIEKPGAAQAELRIGHAGVPRKHESYFELTAMNAVLGGLFSSRINLNLRERHGYTYGAYSGFDWRVEAGPWAVSTAVKTEVSGASVREVLAEIAEIRRAEITTDELELATRYLIGVFPLRFETTAALAGALVTQSTFNLAGDFYETYRERMNNVSPAAVLRAAAAHLHPDQLRVVVTGDPAALRPQLESLELGAVKVHTADEVEAAS